MSQAAERGLPLGNADAVPTETPTPFRQKRRRRSDPYREIAAKRSSGITRRVGAQRTVRTPRCTKIGIVGDAEELIASRAAERVAAHPTLLVGRRCCGLFRFALVGGEIVIGRTPIPVIVRALAGRVWAAQGADIAAGVLRRDIVCGVAHETGVFG